MKETIKSIIDWHEITFPDATLEGQLEKFKKERKECLDSEFTDISELADMFIVACNFTDAQTQDLMGDGWHCGSCQPIFDELAKKIKEGSNAD